jgi:hypothetical protein
MIPWARRQLAKASRTCLPGPCAPEPPPFPGPGWRGAHAFWAVLKPGELTRLCGATCAIRVCVGVTLTFGSGKLATPCSRMQRENAYAAWPGPCEPCVAVVVGELEPHPAANPATATVSAVVVIICPVRMVDTCTGRPVTAP